MADVTNNIEVEGAIAAFVHVNDSDTEPVRTVLALTSKEDLTVTVDESSEDFNPAAERRTRRIRTNNTIDLELSTAVASDLEALSLLGLTDTDGQVTFDSSDRKILASDDEYVEIAYFGDEPDYSAVDIEADSELLHRFEDVEIVSPEVDASASPPMVSLTAWVEGAFYVDYSSA